MDSYFARNFKCLAAAEMQVPDAVRRSTGIVKRTRHVGRQIG